MNDVLDVSVRALADLIGVRINFPNPRENQIGPARKSRSECWPGSRVEFPDVSRRVAREGFVAKVFDEFFIPVRASGYDCVALFTKFLVRDVYNRDNSKVAPLYPMLETPRPAGPGTPARA